ncbi:type II toxin-antitoxin system PemK/MazF family toxin [Paenibacillus sp. MZ04-78.2]|uniref:type II toxin-antitoxin system PemK/MazF family toxin n=1 Tax=Paenibacillus sp. MZ04-78.2 TaxID=2962034 RepID=UPI0020B76A83|nr:type II toxin-antitoxin system PemK/MazF family toxin [Paenibacillus sp. MZ04-78.2]MCP3776406.1 type II toxin-antitoxin system PemK/MazF family toxin [Paenibacillus sp. MZ04-78.2]
MDLIKMLGTITNLHAIDPAVIAQLQQVYRDLTSANSQNVAGILRELDGLFQKISGMSTADRQELLRRLEIMAAAQNNTFANGNRFMNFGTPPPAVTARIGSSTTTWTPPKQFLTEVKPLDVIHCHLAGVGFEYTGDHYAVIWNANPLFEVITVIPTTSKTKYEYPSVFNIGSIPGLPPNLTTLNVDKMLQISRLRITNKYGNLKGATDLMGRDVEERIKQGIAVYYGGEESLENIVRTQCSVAMPKDLVAFNVVRHVPAKFVNFRYVGRDAVLEYRLWNETDLRQLDLIYPNTRYPLAKKRELMKNLFYKSGSDQSNAIVEYTRLFT